ncbi:multimerin-2-like [Gigantopelta aegis]|uniref:multimerin-2-like n=1 Tax=Gigantopelta aegis TaxID=1735272 RepID=UPI001B88D9CD|nr:multimerin-2-like [Gigantopelta aegis]
MCVISQLQPGEFVFLKELEVLKSKLQFQETKFQALEAQLKAKQDSSTAAEFRLFKDGSAIAWLVSTTRDGTGSIQTVTHLHKDQDVWVVKSYGGSTIRGNQLSTFSGFLLRTDDNFHAQLLLQSDGFASKEELEVLKSRIQSQETKIQSLEAQSKTQQDSKALISFRAGFSYKPVQIKFSNGQTVIFDDVYLNDGYAYNSRSGRFHAPMSGLYLFTLDVFPTSSEMEFKLVKDGKAVAWLVSKNSGGRAIIETAIHLHKDQEVWIVKTSGGNALRDSQLSTFSGVLLSADQVSPLA